jgi:moderate conductance mechanosensitive channel
MPHPIAVLAQDEQSAVYRFFFEVTESPWVAMVADSFLGAAFRIFLILTIAYVANRVMRRMIKRSVRRLATEGGMSRLGAIRSRAPLGDTTPMDIGRLTMRAETIAGVLRSIGTVAIWSIAVIMILGEFAINLGPLIAGAGIVGVALGFGSQRLVQDFLSGIFMLVEDQYGLGDIVDAGEATGVIEGITLRTTRIRDVEGTVWHIPNGEITRIGNMSQQWARSLLDIGVAYDTDIPFASDVIKRVADDVWRDPQWRALVIDEPDVWGVENFGASEIVIRLVVKTVPGKQFVVNREIRKRLKAAFDEEGIEIPFPQRTVWFREDNGHHPRPPVPASAAAMRDAPPGSPASQSPDAGMPDNDAGEET